MKKSYGRTEVLRGCSFQIKKGELVGLVGENGSGKSTLVRCLLKFTVPTSGEIELAGSVGYCPQDNFLMRKYTTAEHFRLMEAIYGSRYRIDGDYVEDLMDRLNVMPYLDVHIGHLSSGTYQKLKLITALYHRPELLLLDEPYDGFDWNMYLVFWRIIDELKENNTGILIISHLVYDFAHFDTLYELSGGKLSYANKAKISI
jgi:ABC-type multidrug transport system ATPase subunit